MKRKNITTFIFTVLFTLFSISNVAFANLNSNLVNVGDRKSEIVENIKDIGDHWAGKTITTLIDNDIISGYPDGTFKPDNTISVGEFIKITTSAINEDIEDGEGSDWYLPFVAASVDMGLTQEGEFSDYNREITRGEMARIISRVLEETPENTEELKGQITDFNNIPGELQNHISKVYAAGIITGYEDGSFKHDRTATRAEASAMLLRLLNADERQIPEIRGNVDESKIVIDGEEVAIENEEIIPYYYEAKEVLENTGGELQISDVNSSGFISMALWLDEDTGPYGISVRVSFQYKFDNGIGEEILEPYNINIDKRNKETKKIAKELLKVFYPNNYEKAYIDFIGTIYEGTTVDKIYDNRMFGVKDFPTGTSIYIGR